LGIPSPLMSAPTAIEPRMRRYGGRCGPADTSPTSDCSKPTEPKSLILVGADCQQGKSWQALQKYVKRKKYGATTVDTPGLYTLITKTRSP
jgi:hypothetical protein